MDLLPNRLWYYGHILVYSTISIVTDIDIKYSYTVTSWYPINTKIIQNLRSFRMAPRGLLFGPFQHRIGGDRFFLALTLKCSSVPWRTVLCSPKMPSRCRDSDQHIHQGEKSICRRNQTKSDLCPLPNVAKAMFIHGLLVWDVGMADKTRVATGLTVTLVRESVLQGEKGYQLSMNDVIVKLGKPLWFHLQSFASIYHPPSFASIYCHSPSFAIIHNHLPSFTIISRDLQS